MNQQTRSQDQPSNVPNYPPPTERQFVTQVTHVGIDGTSNPYVGHNNELAARNYAIEVSNRAKVEVTVYAPAGSGGQRLDTYWSGEPKAN